MIMEKENKKVKSKSIIITVIGIILAIFFIAYLNGSSVESAPEDQVYTQQ